MKNALDMNSYGGWGGYDTNYSNGHVRLYVSVFNRWLKIKEIACHCEIICYLIPASKFWNWQSSPYSDLKAYLIEWHAGLNFAAVNRDDGNVRRLYMKIRDVFCSFIML